MTDANKEAIQHQDNLSPDVVALCTLIARIMTRCLREKNPRVMAVLSLSSNTKERETGETPDAA
ncbi:MAG: hypothetical protein PVS3B1_07380 [Ktedonobacteraceae bacterium]